MTMIFVAGTGTDIGKTYVSAGILRASLTDGVPARAIKPVVSGYDPRDAARSDPSILLEAMGREASAAEIAAISPFRFAAPVSADIAARREGRELRLSQVIDFCRGEAARSTDRLLIEGVGGVMSPIAEDGTVLDLVAALELPVVLVAGTYLGAVSHALTAIAVIKAKGLRVSAIVVNESTRDSVGITATMEPLARFAPVAPVFPLARGMAAPVLSDLARSCGFVQ